MSSTNINIGFSESRNSSRVLKPPGGGHSDIFGVKEDTYTPNKRFNHPPSTINNVFMHEEFSKSTDTKNDTNGKEDSITNGAKTEVIDENTKPKEINENKEKEKTEQEAGARPLRVRVPPGGFSSGLW